MRAIIRAIVVLPVPGLPEKTICSDMSTDFRPCSLRSLCTVTMLIRLLTSRLTPSRPISAFSSAFRSSMFSTGSGSCTTFSWVGVFSAVCFGASTFSGTFFGGLTLPCASFAPEPEAGCAGAPQKSSATRRMLFCISVSMTSSCVRMISSRLSSNVINSFCYLPL